MNKLNKIVVLFLFFVLFLSAVFVEAQENSADIASKYQITFPIVALGNCATIGECRLYCEDPLHAESCINFAKAKGFYKEEQLDNRQSDLLEKAKKELGCNSPDSCRSVCHEESNFEKCSDFAKKYNISGGHIENTTEKRFLEKATQILGCDSPASCKTLCENEINREKCSKFAQEVGLRGGERTVGPGGCMSDATCQTFCGNPDNFQICAGFSSAHGGQQKFSGPGGCNSEESCRSYCEKNPQECGHRGEGFSSQAIYNKEEMCSRTPQCSWKNNTCQCESFSGGREENRGKSEDYAKFCRENPEKCKPGMSGGFNNDEERLKFEQHCRDNPEQCQPTTNTGSYPTGTMSQDPATECVKYGCAWNGTTCQCNQSQYAPTTNTGSVVQPTGSSQSTYPSPYPPSSSNVDPAAECSKQSGCSWTGSTCQCDNSSQSTTDQSSSQTSGGDPATECVKYGCAWTGSNCQCAEVKGIETEKTKKSFLQFIFGVLFGK